MTDPSHAGGPFPDHQVPRDAPLHPEPEPMLAGYPPPVPTHGHGFGQPVVPHPYGPGERPGPTPPVVPAGPMPDVPREYHQLLRGPRHTWWRPLVALALAAVMVVAFAIAALPITGAIGFAFGVEDVIAAITDLDDLGPIGFLYVNLSIIGFIPAVMFAVWIAHRVRPRYVSSVAGGIRWRWLLRCVVVLVPVWALYLGIEALLTDPTSPRPPQWPLLLAMVLVLTPFQAAGEEYLTRGLLAQTIGAWFGRPLAGLLVSAPLSATVFALLHGSFDPWVFAGLVTFGLTASVATWRTGGLEAGIAMHTVNNIGVFVVVLTLGGWREAFVTEGTTGTPLSVGVAVLVQSVALAVIVWQARRAGIDRLYRPRAMVLPASYTGVTGAASSVP